jgi:hypothetical protein
VTCLGGLAAVGGCQGSSVAARQRAVQGRLMDVLAAIACAYMALARWWTPYPMAHMYHMLN